MKQILSKWFSWFKRRKLIVKSLMILLFALLVVLFFGGTIAKYYINKNGESLSGRKLHVNSIGINYLTTGVTINDFTMYESDKKDTFVYLGNGYVNMDLWALMRNEFSFSKVEIDRLKIKLVQGDSTFNFSDLISEEPTDTTAAPTKYILKNLQVSNSSITYIDGPNKNTYPIHDMNLSVPMLSWNGEDSDIDLNFEFGEKGKIGIDLKLDNVHNKYAIGLKTHDIDIKYGEVYLKNLFNINSAKGYLHTDLTIQGDLINVLDISFKGMTSLTDVEIIDSKNNPFSSVDSVAVLIDSANLKQFYFDFKETYILNPVVHATLTHNSTNIEDVLAPVLGDGSTEEVSEIDTVSQETPFHFELGKATIENGLIKYTDQTLDRPFSYNFKNIHLTALNIADDTRNLLTEFKINMNDKGIVTGSSKFDVVNTNNVTLKAITKNVDLISFSPYSEYFMASPITQGTFNYDFDLSMTETQMLNNNSFDIRELEFGKKMKSDSAYKVPVKLALVLMKDKNDNIQFDIPVSGNPSDPDFKLFPIILKTFGKFMVKAASSPISAVSSLAGTNPEDLEFMPFDFGQSELNERQINLLDKIIEIHTKKPELAFTFIQMTHIEEEKEFIAVQEAKKKYMPYDWQSVGDKDEGFIGFLIKKSGMAEGSSIEEMAVKLIGAGGLSAKLTALLQSRNASLTNHFLKEESMAGAIHVETADFQNLPSELKKQQYKIEVSVK